MLEAKEGTDASTLRTCKPAKCWKPRMFRKPTQPKLGLDEGVIWRPQDKVVSQSSRVLRQEPSKPTKPKKLRKPMKPSKPRKPRKPRKLRTPGKLRESRKPRKLRKPRKPGKLRKPRTKEAKAL